METKKNRIQFCFPNANQKNKANFINSVIKNILSDTEVGYAGFAKKSYLAKHISKYVDAKKVKLYKHPESKIINGIKMEIEKTLKICTRSVSGHTISVYVFPWIGERYDESFAGVNGFAPYRDVIHIFISLNKFSMRSLSETLAHEFSHAVFFNNKRNSHNLSLIEAMVMEGIAENFREESVGGKVADWSKALSKKETISVLRELQSMLDSSDFQLYRDIFFGNNKFKKWTGYSIGYRLIKEFLKSNRNTSWVNLMKMEVSEILFRTKFIK